MKTAKVQKNDNQIVLFFDYAFETTLADLINDNKDDCPITENEARMIRELDIGDYLMVGMIEITKLK